MKTDQCSADDGLAAPGRQMSRRRRGLLGYRTGTLVFASLAVGAVFAVLSLVMMAVTVRILLGERSGAAGSALVVAGTVVGACIGAWSTQPALARLIGTPEQVAPDPERDHT